jgi:hypothetical protein
VNRPYRDRKTGQPITVTNFQQCTVAGRRTAVYEFTCAAGPFGRLLSAAFNRQYERVEEEARAEVGK